MEVNNEKIEKESTNIKKINRELRKVLLRFLV